MVLCWFFQWLKPKNPLHWKTIPHFGRQIIQIIPRRIWISKNPNYPKRIWMIFEWVVFAPAPPPICVTVWDEKEISAQYRISRGTISRKTLFQHVVCRPTKVLVLGRCAFAMHTVHNLSVSIVKWYIGWIILGCRGHSWSGTMRDDDPPYMVKQAPEAVFKQI